MKVRNFLLVTAFSLFLISCGKEKPEPVPVPPAGEVLVKDIVIRNLPSPYYHFEYSAAKEITKVGFSSGLAEYDLSYATGRLTEMKNTISSNNDRLVYEYQDGKVFLIKIFNKAGELYRRCFLTYDNNGRLQQLEWDLKIESIGFANLRMVQLSYYPDGNLSELRDQRFAVGSTKRGGLY
jgi:hypothetical protein